MKTNSINNLLNTMAKLSKEKAKQQEQERQAEHNRYKEYVREYAWQKMVGSYDYILDDIVLHIVKQIAQLNLSPTTIEKTSKLKAYNDILEFIDEAVTKQYNTIKTLEIGECK